MFLNEVVKEYAFKSTKELCLFLSGDKNSFEKAKNEIGNYPKDISEIPHEEGKAKLNITDKKIVLSSNISKYCNEAVVLYEKLKLSNKKIAEVMFNLSNLLVERSEVFKSLSIINTSIKVICFV